MPQPRIEALNERHAPARGRGTPHRFAVPSWKPDPARISTPRTSAPASVSYAHCVRTRYGSDSAHCHTGTSGITASHSHAAVCTMRAAPRDGQYMRSMSLSPLIPASSAGSSLTALACRVPCRRTPPGRRGRSHRIARARSRATAPHNPGTPPPPAGRTLARTAPRLPALGSALRSRDSTCIVRVAGTSSPVLCARIVARQGRGGLFGVRGQHPSR